MIGTIIDLFNPFVHVPASYLKKKDTSNENAPIKIVTYDINS